MYEEEGEAFEYKVGGIQLPLPAVKDISGEGEQYVRWFMDGNRDIAGYCLVASGLKASSLVVESVAEVAPYTPPGER